MMKRPLLLAAAIALTGCERSAAQKSADQPAVAGEIAPDQIEPYAWGSTDHDRFLVGDDRRTSQIMEDSTEANPDNRIVMAKGIMPADVRIGRKGFDMVLQWSKHQATTITGQYADLPGHTFGVQRVDFADGTTWSHADLVKNAGIWTPIWQIPPLPSHPIGPPMPPDWAERNARAIQAAEAGSTLYAGGDHDRIKLPDRSMTVIEASTSRHPDNEIEFDPRLQPADATVSCMYDGFDIQFNHGTQTTLPFMRASRRGVTYGVQKLRFANGTVWTADDLLRMAQQPRDNIFPLCDDRAGRVIDTARDHGPGRDASGIEGRGGGDTIIMRRDAIHYRYGILEEDVSGHANNVLQFDSGIAPADLTFKAVGEDLEIDPAPWKGTIVLYRQLRSYPGRVFGIQQVRFADGNRWDNATFRAKLAAAGIVAPAPGAAAGGPQFIIDTATPVIHGSGHGDTILYRPIVGNAEIYENTRWTGHDAGDFPKAPNVLKLAPPITRDMVKIAMGDGQDIVLLVGSASAIRLIEEHALSSGVQIIEFADGSRLTQADVIAAADRNPVKTTGVNGPRVGE